MNIISQFIKEKRKEQNLTQEEFAKASGLGIHFVRDLEQGKETVRMDKVNQALAYFGSKAVPDTYQFETHNIFMNTDDNQNQEQRIKMYAKFFLSQNIIDESSKESVPMVKGLFTEKLDSVILYGSCARGDYKQDSDIDIALIVDCDRSECNSYWDALSWISTELTKKYFALYNFIMIPVNEYLEKREWYPLFLNIHKEGRILYER